MSLLRSIWRMKHSKGRNVRIRTESNTDSSRFLHHGWRATNNAIHAVLGDKRKLPRASRRRLDSLFSAKFFGHRTEGSRRWPRRHQRHQSRFWVGPLLQRIKKYHKTSIAYDHERRYVYSSNVNIIRARPYYFGMNVRKHMTSCEINPFLQSSSLRKTARVLRLSQFLGHESWGLNQSNLLAPFFDMRFLFI